MDALPQIRLSLRATLAMVWSYARVRLLEQVRAVSFVVLYLLAFQILVFNTTPAHAGRVAAGIGMFIVGLTFFLEGIFLGLMPLGEQVGVQLPRRVGLVVIMAFGWLLGIGSTLAEPAVAALRVAGRGVNPWDAPLLFRILENEPGGLAVAIGVGVGFAVACGMVRFYYGLALKPFIGVLVPALLLLCVICTYDANLKQILGLAWDAGAVTTGAVTVPLVLALGIGVARAMGKRTGVSAGLGVVAFASLFPVLGVIGFGAWLNQSTPGPMAEAAFFAPSNRAAALRLAGSEEDLRRLAFQRGGEVGRRACHPDDDAYLAAVRSLADPAARRALLGDLSLADWLMLRASHAERLLMPTALSEHDSGVPLLAGRRRMLQVVAGESWLALRAVVPLSLLLLSVLLFLLRERPRHRDEVALGMCLALVGMVLLTSGIRLGVAPLGDEAGRPLPRVFRSVEREVAVVMLAPFDPSDVLTAFDVDGVSGRFFYFRDAGGVPRPVVYDERRFDAATGRYEHVLSRRPLFGPKLTLVGIGLVGLFAFGLGYGSTLAEPALSALGRTVEDVTVGTIKRAAVVRAVSLGVGLGLVVGVARILYDLPTIWLIVPPYLLLLPLTYWSEEDFAGIAWDCGGVTTGIVTVPLVLAMGLGIGGDLGIVDGFGVLAMASVYPVITVLLYGMVIRVRQSRSIGVAGEEDDE